MEYRVAPSFKGYKLIGTPFTKSGKLYSAATRNCERCSGSGIYTWGASSQFSGTCFACNGTGKVTKEIRLYTESEYTRLIKATGQRHKKAATREAARVEKNKEQAAALKLAFAKEHNFNDDLITYVVVGDTYSIKDTLKSAGFKFDIVLNWHNVEAAGFECIEIKFDDVYDWNVEAATATYKENAADIVRAARTPAAPASNYYPGEIGDRIRKIAVTLISARTIETSYGVSNLFQFVDTAHHILTWFTSADKDWEVGEAFTFSGTIKKFNCYNGSNQTVVTRVLATRG